MIINEEKVNLSYQKEFDVAKALAIFFMVTIHVYEELSVVDSSIICETAFDTIIQFLGGPLAAPVFMFAMGIGLAYSKHREPKNFIKRGVIMLIFSYLFNVIRFTIPLLISEAPDLPNLRFLLYETFHIDILTFAGWTFILTGILKQLKVPVIAMGAIALAMQAVGLYISTNFTFESRLVIYLLGGFIKTGMQSYFPLTLWYIYPVLGLIFAKYLRHINDTDKFYGGLLALSSTLLAVFIVTLNFIGYDIRYLFTLADDIYYLQTFLHVFFSLCCILIELSLIHFIQKVPHSEKLDKASSYLSGNLNNIYIVQWIIIGWLNAVAFDYESVLEPAYIVPVALIIIIISCLLVNLYQKVTKRKNIL